MLHFASLCGCRLPGIATRSKDATSNKCIASSNKCLTSSNKKLLGAPGIATRSKCNATRVEAIASSF